MTRTTTTELAEWLGRHGLGQYAKTFAENSIDYCVLPDLTENDLEKLGVSSLGHRKKLLRAIEALTLKPCPPAQQQRFQALLWCRPLLCNIAKLNSVRSQ